MKLKDYKFESKDELNSVASSVLSYFGKTINPVDIEYAPIIEYKVRQLKSLLGDEYNIDSKDLMRYLSYPIGVQNLDDSDTFGIRTNKGSGNGKINMHLSKMILFRSMEDDQSVLFDRLFDTELDDIDRLPGREEYLDCYVPSMLREPELLCYLFFTGRGEEFTKLFGDTAFLTRLEDGSFKPYEIEDRMPRFREGKSEASPLLRSLVKEDLLRIKSLAGDAPVKEGNKLVR